MVYVSRGAAGSCRLPLGVAWPFGILSKQAFRVPYASRKMIVLSSSERAMIIGAGPAGLTAGYKLANNRYKGSGIGKDIR
jgi:hypothetical protein